MEKDLEMNFKDYMSIYEIAVGKFNKRLSNDYFINNSTFALEKPI